MSEKSCLNTQVNRVEKENDLTEAIEGITEMRKKKKKERGDICCNV